MKRKVGRDMIPKAVKNIISIYRFYTSSALRVVVKARVRTVSGGQPISSSQSTLECLRKTKPVN